MSQRTRKIVWMALAIAFVLLLILAFADPVGFARGYLAAFVLLSMVPIGSLLMLLVGGLTGGDWMADFGPVLVRAARLTFLLPIAFIPIIILRPAIYSWPGGGGIPGDVTRLYLNPPFFALRSLIGLLILAFLCWRAAWTRQAIAGIGLMVTAIVLSLLPADWILTLPPRSTSAAFGLGFGIEQILAALAFCAVLAPQGRMARASTDLAGMIASAILGTIYFLYMEFIITWYGNIPDKVHWYVVRTAAPWPPVAFLAFAIGAALPFLAILAPGIRASARHLRVVGALVLVGIVLHVTWLVLAAFASGTLGPALLSAVTLGLLFAGLVPWLGDKRLAHGS